MTRSDLAKKLFKTCYLTGEFKLRSGQMATEYFDKYRFESQPELLKEVAKAMSTLVPKDTDCLAGLEMGGIPIATALSFETGIPLVFVRKKAKDYGTCRFAEGLDIRGKNLLVIEDVITTGGQVIQSTEDLRGDGAVIKNVLCVVNRGQNSQEILKKSNLNLTHLFTFDELKKA